ncbi:hypothetical protein AX14_003004, partial [Amanita brunnescens Koide BX004]
RCVVSGVSTTEEAKDGRLHCEVSFKHRKPSAVVLVMASELSLELPKIVNGSFIRSCSVSRSKSIIPLTTFSPTRRVSRMSPSIARQPRTKQCLWVLKASNPFNIMRGDLATVLGRLQYILEMAMSMSPNLTPEKGTCDELKADLTDLDDNPSLYHNDSDDSDGDEDEASDENDYYS